MTLVNYNAMPTQKYENTSACSIKISVKGLIKIYEAQVNGCTYSIYY